MDKITDYFIRHYVDQKQQTIATKNSLLGKPNNYGLSNKYQHWLMSEGVRVVIDNKKPYLEFFSDQEATMFLMRFS